MKPELIDANKNSNPDIIAEIVEKVKSGEKCTEDQFDSNQTKAKKLMEFIRPMIKVHLFVLK